MTDNVTQFPAIEPPEFLLGPFTEYCVIIDGRRIPRLTGHREGDKVWLTVDGRITAYFSSDENAYQAAVLAANALAIGAGYPCADAETKERPFAPKISRLEVP